MSICRTRERFVMLHLIIKSDTGRSRADRGISTLLQSHHITAAFLYNNSTSDINLSTTKKNNDEIPTWLRLKRRKTHFHEFHRVERTTDEERRKMARTSEN